MFQRILVPLDGSVRAEHAILIAKRIARATGGAIILLRIVPPRLDHTPSLIVPSPFKEELLQDTLAQVSSYLADVVSSTIGEEIKTEIHALSGIPMHGILTFAQKNKIDLIVLCSHGYTGFKRWALGSVAQHIVRHSAVPLLLVREGGPQPATQLADASHPLRALVALDGSSLAEATLVPTIHLAAALSAPRSGEVHLLSVVTPPTKPQELLDEVELQDRALHASATYLNLLADELSMTLATELGVKIITSVTMSDDVADTLIREAELGEESGAFQAYDLLALATHGRSGLERWMMGSITEWVLHGSKLPLLIVRPQRQQTHTYGEIKEQVAGKR